MIEQKISELIWKQKYRFDNESINDTYFRLSHFSGKNDKERKSFYNMFSNHRALPAGRIIYSLGTTRKEVTLSNCFVIPIKGDNIHAIMKAVKDASMTIKSGGGVGYNFSVLRPHGAMINTIGEPSRGSVRFIGIFDAVCETLIAGGNRKGAQIAVLDIWHPDIEEFISVKRDGSLKNFNISVGMSNSFMTAVEKDEDWNLEFPETTDPDYDEFWRGDLNDWKKRGKKVVVYKVVKAKKLYEKIMRSNYDFADPGILFIDKINEQNNLYYMEKINCVNPCGEQPLSDMSACLLGSINIASHVKNEFTKDANIDFDLIGDSAKNMVRVLNSVLDINKYPIEEQMIDAYVKRLIGIGITGFGDAMAMIRVKYGSKNSISIMNKIMLTIRDNAYIESINMAIEDGPFPGFDKDKYMSSNFIRNFPKGIRDEISKYGIRNARILSIAPTGTISMFMNNVSSGIEPIFSLEYDRKIRINGENYENFHVEDYAWSKYKLFMNDPHLKPEDAPEFFSTVSSLTVDDHLNVQACAQEFVDTSISKTLNVPVDFPFEKFSDIYIKAWKMGLKGCTTYRPNNITGSVLTDNDMSKDGEFEIKSLPVDGKAVRHKVVWKDGAKVYIMVTIDDEGMPLEIFSKIPKEVGINGHGEFNPISYLEKVSYWESICRLISLSLRSSVPVDCILDQLDKSSYSLFDLSAIIKRVLSMYPVKINGDVVSKGKGSIKLTGMICPECGESTLIKQSGCYVCTNCTYSRCE